MRLHITENLNMDDQTPRALPPSGPWSGYYLYRAADLKHRMQLGLTFSPHGTMWGDGIDDIGPFTINGIFDAASNQARWTKSYVGKHNVEYHGFYDQRSICGNWTMSWATGGFWIWPREMQGTDVIEAEVEQPSTETVSLTRVV